MAVAVLIGIVVGLVIVLIPVLGWIITIAGLVVIICFGLLIWVLIAYRSTVKGNPRKLVKAVVQASDKLYGYHNNLDELLGVVTTNRDHSELDLSVENTLWIDNCDYDWYLTAKHSTELAFKVVGLHKTDKAENVVYILGKNSTTKLPYLIQETDVEGALARLDNIGITLPGSEAELNSAVLGMINVMIGASLMPAINKITEDIVRGR